MTTSPPALDFQIGSTSSMTLLQNLTLSPAGEPLLGVHSTFDPATELVENGDRSVTGIGSPVAHWLCGKLTRAQRDALRTFCTGYSSTVWIRTVVNDGGDVYANFTGTMRWPLKEQRESGGRVVNLDIEFVNLVAA